MENFDYIQNYQQVTLKNYDFLWKETKDSYTEAVYLTIDANNFVDFINEKFMEENQQPKKEFSNWCMITYGYNILVPFSHGIFSDMLTGNLPVCFFQLRMLLESLVKCFYADSKYPRHLFFDQKLGMLEIETESKSISQIIKETTKILSIDQKPLSNLWKRLSSEWVHPEKTIKREKLLPAPPTIYIKEDISNIKKLECEIIKFREISYITTENWKQYID